MECTKKHLMGIAIGAAVVVLVANILNHFLGWEISAIIVGLVAGLEAGFWTGATTVTKEVHKEVYGALRGLPRQAPSIIAVLGILGSGLLLYPATYCFSIKFLFNHIPFQLDFIKISFLVFSLIGSVSCLVWFIFLAGTMIDGGYSWFEKLIQKGAKGNLGSAAIVVLASPLAGIVAAGAVVVVLIVGPIFLVAVALRFVVAPAFLALIILCGKHETATIAVGVVIGGLSGLAYGWTHMALPATTMAMLIGAVVGMASGWTTVKVSQALCKLTEKPMASAT